MADVAKTPLKRKSFGGKQDTAKKQKNNPVKTPSKGATPKPQNGKSTPPNPNMKNQKKSSKSKDVVKTPNQNAQQNKQGKQFTKKPKKFEGTAAIQSPVKQEGKEEKSVDKKKIRRTAYFQYKQILSGGDNDAKKELITTLENKIKNIAGRSELSKSAKRKLKLLNRIKKSAEGGKTGLVPNTANVVSKPNVKKASTGVVKKGIVQKPQAGKSKLNQKVQIKKPKLEVEEEELDEQSDDEEEGSEEEASDEEVSDEVNEEEGEDDTDGDDDDSDEDEADSDDEEDDDDESEEEDNTVPKQDKSKTANSNKEVTTKCLPNPAFNPSDIDELKKNDIVGKNQKRYILFVGNLPYDTNREDLKGHFQKCGIVKHIRIPVDKNSNKPRGFAYIELENTETYQKCLSMHHTFLKGRRINVLYTLGGKKKGENQKKEIKAKNFKLHALRKEGKLAGSKKESQKRSFRRKKQQRYEPKVKTEC